MILDLMMPGIDGFEVLRTIRETEGKSYLPVLILTAKHISKEELKFLKHNHVYELIQKGDINRAQLLKIVSRMLASQTDVVENQRPARHPIEGKPTVLVVEDTPDNMLTIKTLLADNYVIIEAADGQAAIDFSSKYMPDLILMDIALPLINGIQAFEKIRNASSSQHIPVIAITASAMAKDRETILAQGFDGYVSKPIDQAELMHVIQQVLYGK
jgi:CheY-like chemotaxis protein